MLTYVVFFLLMIIQSTLGYEPKLNYTCNQEGVATIDVDNVNKTYILVDETQHIYCKPTTKDMKNCFNNTGKTQRPRQLKVLYELELNPKIVGGKQPFYFNLTCVDGPRNLTASASFNQTKFNEIYHSKSENVTWSEQLELKISRDSTGNKISTDVEIGQALYLFMTVPANYKISPESCVAKPTAGDDKDSVNMWKVTKDNTCDQYDQALIDNKWNDTNGKLSIIMYGFRFVKSESVTVTCNALVCPVSAPSLCTQLCVNHPVAQGGGRRRRNAIEKSLYSQKSASVSFRVETRVKANGTTGLTPNTVVYPFVLFLWMTWMERHALF